MIQIERYKGIEADVNSYILSSADAIILVDTLRNSAEAEGLAAHIAHSGKQLACIFITHGHPDHFLGLGVLHRHFPTVPVRVASAAIRDDIVGFAGWMESVGWLESEPDMKVRTAGKAGGFDYQTVIGVLDEPYLRFPSGEEPIQVRADYPGTECGHMTTLAIPGQKAFLAADLLYDKVHAWCGQGVDKQEIQNWIKILDDLARAHDEAWTFYAGHGGAGDRTLLGNMKAYLRKFLEVTAAATTRQAAIDEMKQAFPGFAQDDFLLVHSVDFHVTEDQKR